MNTRYTTARTWFNNFMQVQLFLSLISLPILIAWGLPFSVMTVFGNLLFTPLLSFFLLLSTIVFFSELLGIANGWSIYFLEKTFDLWMYCLNYNSPSWLVCIDYYGCLLAVFCALCALVIMQHKYWGRAKNSWILFCYLLLIPFGYQSIRFYTSHHLVVTCLKKTANVTSRYGKNTVIDKGALGEKQAASTWVQYTFLSEVAKTCGSLHFESITSKNPNPRTLEALTTLCQHAQVDTIVVEHPYKKSREYKEKLQILKETAGKRHVKLTEQHVTGKQTNHVQSAQLPEDTN